MVKNREPWNIEEQQYAITPQEYCNLMFLEKVYIEKHIQHLKNYY
jgi:hypothetical protein